MRRYNIVPTAAGNVMRQAKCGNYVPHQDAALLEKQVDYDQGRIADLQRQLAEVTRERDTLKAMVELHDAMNDRRRLAQETPHKRRQYENG